MPEDRRVHPLVAFREQVEERRDEFMRALPAHIPVARFMRVLLTAVQNNPDLLGADRQTLFNSAMRAAQDGLLPDGREGAIVIYRTKKKDRDGNERWIDAAQWMPMVFGILKKIRNSGEVAMITARVVYAGDKFRYWIDDNGEHVEYEPSDEPDTGIVRRVFAMAKTNDGELYVEPMTAEQVEKVRNVSRSKDKGPWKDWWDEMAKKTVIRRLAKRLPMSTDLDDLIRRDDALYDLDGASDRQRVAARPGLGEALDRLAGSPAATAPAIEHRPADVVDMDTGELVDEREPVPAEETREEQRQVAGRGRQQASDGRRTGDAREVGDGRRSAPRGEVSRFADEVEAEAVGADLNDEPREQTPTNIAFDKGWSARRADVSRRACPWFATTAEADAWREGWDAADAEIGS